VPFEKLTRREREVLEQTASGKSIRQIAFDLGIAFKTAACHRQRIVNKLKATNIVDAICRAARMAVIDLHSNHATPLAGLSGEGERFERLRRENQALIEESRTAREKCEQLRAERRNLIAAITTLELDISDKVQMLCNQAGVQTGQRGPIAIASGRGLGR
jgi:DNA-binding CsgD family transcriptional regulator